MDFIQFVNSKDIRKYLYDINYKLSVDQMIFVVLRCMFISVDKKIEALLEIKRTTSNVALSSIGRESYFNELSGIMSYEFIDRCIDNFNQQLVHIKTSSDENFYEVKSLAEDAGGEYSHYAYYRTFDQCIKAIKTDRELLDENIFFEIIKHSFSNPENDGSICTLSKNLEVMVLLISQPLYDKNGKKLEDIYDQIQFVSLPMPFKKGDIVKANCPPYLFRFRDNSNCVFLGYRPHCAEDLRPHRDGVDILFFAYYAANYGFSQSDGDPFSYELEYATLDPKKYKDQKLILLSDLIKGKLGPDAFYLSIRYLESKENMSDEKDYFCSWGIDSEYEFLKESFNHK